MSKMLKYKTKYITLKNEINQIIIRLKNYHKNIKIIQKNINERLKNNLYFIIITGNYAIGKTNYCNNLNKIYNYPIINFNKIIYEMIYYSKNDIIDQIFIKFNAFVLNYQYPIIIDINIKYLNLLLDNYDLKNYIIFLLNPTNIELYCSYLILKIKDDIVNNRYNLSTNIYNFIDINDIIRDKKIFYENYEIIKKLAFLLINNTSKFNNNNNLFVIDI